MVALARDFDSSQIRAELLLVLERDAVDALQHLVLLVAAPVRAREFGELPRSDLPRALHVRAPAEIDEAPVPEERDVLIGRDVVEARELQLFAERLERPPRLRARHDDALECRVLRDDAAHLGLDARKIVGGDARRDVEVVLELLGVIAPADIDLCRRPEPLHRVRHHVLGRVADHDGALGIAGGDDSDPSTARGKRRTQVDESTADLSGERGFRESRADPARDVERSAPAGHAHTCAIRQLEFHFSAAHVSIVRGAESRILVGTGGFEPPTPTVSR